MHGKEKTAWNFQTVSEQRYRDSNPNIQSQSLLCYLYTIPLCRFGAFGWLCAAPVLSTGIIIPQRVLFVNPFFEKS